MKPRDKGLKKGGYNEVSLYQNDITGAKNIVRFTEDFVT